MPTFNTDTIRSEICEDYLKFDENEAQRRIKKRYSSIIKEWKSFILDASIDRKWWTLKEDLIKNWYKYFIISIDLDKETLLKFYKAKSYSESMKIIDKVYENHQNFLKEYSSDINLHINENNYKKRLEIAYEIVYRRMEKIEKC